VSTFDEQFPDWYRLTAIDPGTIPLAARRSAIDNLISEPSADDTLQLVLTAYGRGSIPFVEKMRAAFRSTDDTFPGRDNDLEMSLLAGATIARLVASSSRQADLASLALESSNWFGWKVNPHELPDVARDYRDAESVRMREESDKVAPPNTAGLRKAVDAIGASVPSGSIPPQEVDDLAKAISTSLTSIVRAWEGFTTSAEKLANARSEELEVLWWLLSGRSTDLDGPRTDLPPGPAALVVGKELADRTRLLPGLPSVRGLIDRALPEQTDRQTSASAAIDGAPRDWMSQLSADVPTMLAGLLPLHLAVNRAMAVPSGTEWIKAAEFASVPVTDALRADELALKFYIERLTIRAYRDV
jgi:hypothetical protein